MDYKEKISKIVNDSIKAVLPDNSVIEALESLSLEGHIHIIAIGKAAWRMSNAAANFLSENYPNSYCGGICITKYDHSEGKIDKVQIFESGHPSPDENTILATEKAIEYAKKLDEKDTLLFLVSGGGSALFETPTVSLDELNKINSELLASGKDIVEINSIRKKYSKVKGGKFAEICQPAKVINLILSDVLGDDLKSIASGPTITNDVTSILCGNLSKLCSAAKQSCEALGYKTLVLKENMTGIAKDEAKWFANEALKYANDNEKIALIAGGETVVKLTGSGKGGRNQEFALACVPIIKNKNICIFSIGSDGTDGPTDAAGGFSTGASMGLYSKNNIDVDKFLDNNDSYNALKETEQLIVTGPTGTNVNDVAVALIN